MNNLATRAKNSFTLNFIIVISFVFILRGYPVPFEDELVYLLSPLKQLDSNFLLNDWTFSRPDKAHLVFNVLMAPFYSLLSLEFIGWSGRIICWSLIILALFRIGRLFQISLWMITISILLWLAVTSEVAVVGGEWIIGGFGGKSISYFLLLFSLLGFINNKVVLPSIFLGLCFSFHPAVGLWGGIATISSLIVLKYPIKKLCQIIFLTALFSLPGVIPLIPLVFGNNNVSIDEWKFLALMRLPRNLDPFSWGKVNILALYILFLFNWLHSLRNKENHAIRFLISFQFFLGLFFLLGIFFRYNANFDFLKFYPFRLFPVFVQLFFFFHLMNAYLYLNEKKLMRATAVIGLVALLSFPNALGEFVDQVKFNYGLWIEKEDDLQMAYKWVSKNTPNGSIIISPPLRKECSYLSKRAQIVNWRVPTPDRIGEWRERLECMVGKVETYNPWDRLKKMEDHYNHLKEEDIELIIKKYGGDYLVSRGNYNYPLFFSSGTYKVFLLKKPIVSKLLPK